MTNEIDYCAIAVYGDGDSVLSTAVRCLTEVGGTYTISCLRSGTLLIHPDGLEGAAAERMAQYLSERTGAVSATAYGFLRRDCRFAVYDGYETIAHALYTDGIRRIISGVAELIGSKRLTLPELAFLPWESEQEYADDWEDVVCRDIFSLYPCPPLPEKGCEVFLDETMSNGKVKVLRQKKHTLSKAARYYHERLELLTGSSSPCGRLERISYIHERLYFRYERLYTADLFPPVWIDSEHHIKRRNYYEFLPDGRMVLCEDTENFYSRKDRWYQNEPFISSRYDALIDALEEHGYKKIGFDKNSQLFVWKRGKGVYIFDIGLTYCNFEPVTGDFLATYLNKDGDTCMIFECELSGEKGMVVYRVPCCPCLPDKRLPPLESPVNEMKYACCHIRRGGNCTVPPKLIKALANKPDNKYRILRDKCGGFISIYGIEYEKIIDFARELSGLLSVNVLATYGVIYQQIQGISYQSQNLHLFVNGEEIIYLSNKEGCEQTKYSRNIDVLEKTHVDKWIKQHVIYAINSTIAEALNVRTLFPTPKELKGSRLVRERMSNNVEICAIVWEDAPYHEERARLRELLKNAVSDLEPAELGRPRFVELGHLKGEVERSTYLRNYLPQSQRIILYDPSHEHELGRYGIAPDGTIVPWNSDIGKRRENLPNFLAIERFYDKYDALTLPYSAHVIGIDGKERIYLKVKKGTKQGICITDRGCRACSFVEFKKSVDGWYQNDMGELCFFANIPENSAKPDIWAYKVVFDDGEGGDDFGLG